MKKLFIVILFLVPVFLQAENLKGLFDQGNEKYRHGRYEEAIKFYELILSKNIKNGHVYFNLGNSYYKQNNIGKAILNYERAKNFLPRDQDVQFNLRFAHSQKRDTFSETDENPFTKIILFIYNVFSLNTLFWIVYGLLLVIIASLLFRWFNKNIDYQVINQKVTYYSVIIFIILLFILVVKVYETKTTTYGIIIADESKVKSGPSQSYTDIFNLHAGTKVRIRKENNDWYLVSIPNGYNGYINKNELEKI